MSANCNITDWPEYISGNIWVTGVMSSMTNTSPVHTMLIDLITVCVHAIGREREREKHIDRQTETEKWE